MSFIEQFQMKDQYGFVVENTPMDEMRVVTPYRLVGTTFQETTKDTNFWSETVANDGTVVQANNQVTLSTKTTSPNGAAVYRSVRNARYVGSISNRFRAQIQLGDTGEANNIRIWGCYDGADGCFFELNGTTLNIVTAKGASLTKVASASWNANTTAPTLTDCNTYEIYYMNKKVYFVINGILMHTVIATSTTWSNKLTFPIYLSTINANALQTDKTLICRVATIVRLGSEKTEPIYKHIAGAATTVCKYGSGKLHSIVINSPGTLCTVYDDMAGSTGVIAIIDTNKTTGIVSQATYNCPFFNGLTIITTGAGSDITVIYE